jgi:type I restriction enzyme S subunit
MAFKSVRLGEYFKFEKGLGYKGEFLVSESSVALIGMDSHEESGGYKEGSEKPYSGPYKEVNIALPGDVIFSATDLTQDGHVLGSPLLVPESEKFQTFIYSHHVLKACPKKEGFLPEYLYNIYRVEKFRAKAAFGDSGTTVRALPAEVLEEQIVPLPDLTTQQAINEIIAMLDQQIANNRALSKNLEKLAQSIFKSWFIDFDPVRAKIEGEKPSGMDDFTASLFPSSFQQSEIGEIPKGWDCLQVSEILERIKVKPLPASTAVTLFGRTPVLEQGNSILAGFTEKDSDVDASADDPKFIFGDHTCRMKVLTIPFCIMPNTIVLRGKSRNSYWAFGATFGIQKFESYRRHWMELAVRKIATPTAQVADCYGDLVAPLFMQIDSLMIANINLQRTISEILPALLEDSNLKPSELISS